MRRSGHAHNDDSAHGLQSMPRCRRSDMQALGRSKACLSHDANARRHPICFVLASMQRDRAIPVETLCDCSAAATMSAVTQSPSHLLQAVGVLQVEVMRIASCVCHYAGRQQPGSPISTQWQARH